MKNNSQHLSDLFENLPQSGVHDSFQNVCRGKNLIVYGAGNGYIAFSRSVLKRLCLKPILILDNKFREGDMYDGVKAISLDHYEPKKDDILQGLVVVTIGDKEAYRQIEQRLKEVGFNNVVKSSSIYEFNVHHISPELKIQGRDFYWRHRKDIEDTMGLWGDTLSQEVYLGMMKTYMSQKPEEITASQFDEQYFPADISLSKGYSRFVNCGSYDGDTIRQLNIKHGKVQALACFEPDQRNFALLKQYLKENRGRIADQVLAFPCGVFNDDIQLSFSADRYLCSSAFDEGAAIIQCVALDDAIPDFKPTFISMDVEGAEPEALAGARQLISRNAPDLAISVYHFPHHLWDIPLTLHGLGLGYRFYLRNYTGFTYETILYAGVQ